MLRVKLNIAQIIHFVSIIMVFESLFMLTTVIVSAYNKEAITGRLFAAFIYTLIFGLILNLLTQNQRHKEPTRRDSIIIVCLGWIIMGLVGTIPYLITRSIPNFTNAFFESISGFTTTGSSILADIEVLPKSILLWRAETHWIGGMGIIVLVVAIMPFLNINGIYLYSSETSTAAEEKVSVRIKNTARSLWLVYIGLTVAEIILLLFGKVSLFDSVCNSFATIATGGFSTKNASIAAFSPYVQYVVMIFMMLAGINFALHVFALKGNMKRAFKNEELRAYLSIIGIAGLIITFILYLTHNVPFERAFRESFFQVISIITATGFATSDYLQWPIQGILIIALLMLIGASAGSTGGGVKVIRHVIAFKKIKQSFREITSPNAIHVIRYNNNVLDITYVNRIITYILLYYSILAVGTVVMILLGNDGATSFGSVATCMAGIGPGFGTVGPVSNFLHLHDASKYLLTFFMVIGRLEIYSFIIIFTRTFWSN